MIHFSWPRDATNTSPIWVGIVFTFRVLYWAAPSVATIKRRRFMNEWVWSVGETILSAENGSTVWRKIYPSSNLSTKNCTRTGPKLNPVFRRELLRPIWFFMRIVEGRLGSRLRSYHSVAPRPLRPLVPPVITRGAPRQVTWETSVSEGRNWARNGRSIWPAITTST
jgi:hypothetical protein